MTGPTLTRLDLARDRLAEARRYTHTRPDAAIHLLDLALRGIGRVERKLDGRLADDFLRIRRNLAVGWLCIRAAPDVTDAYITGALWELGDLASRLRKAAEAEGRDAELSEAYGPKNGDT